MTENNQTSKKKRVRRDRREEILQEAGRLFGIHGFRGASLSSIAKAVDLTEPGLLHYFPSKVHLLQGVLAYRDQQDSVKYKALLDTGENTIFGSLEDLITENEKIPGLIRLFTILVGESIRDDHPAHDYFLNRYSELRKGFADQLMLFIESERLNVDVDVNQLSTLIAAVMDGLQIQWLLDPEQVSMTDTYNLFSKIVIDYLRNE